MCTKNVSCGNVVVLEKVDMAEMKQHEKQSSSTLGLEVHADCLILDS